MPSPKEKDQLMSELSMVMKYRCQFCGESHPIAVWQVNKQKCVTCKREYNPMLLLDEDDES